MKKEKCKSKETFIGKVITAFLLFLPLLAIGVTCGYAMFNKNAYQSYSINTEEKTVVVSNGETLNPYTLYNVEYARYGSTNNNVYSVYDNKTDLHKFGQQLQGKIITGFRIAHATSQSRLYIIDDQNVEYYFQNWNASYGDFYFVMGTNNTINSTSYSLGDINLLETIYVKGNLDNIFYYAVDKVQQSPLFNWAEYTGMYTAMHTFTTQLGITTTFFPLLLTYWLFIFLIYILYDFALIPLNIIHKKIHEMSDTI